MRKHSTDKTYLREFLEEVFPEIAATLKQDEVITLPEDMKALYGAWCMKKCKGGK